MKNQLTKEQRAARARIVDQTMNKHSITKEQATKRVEALFDSGLLYNFDPENKVSQLLIDEFLQINLE